MAKARCSVAQPHLKPKPLASQPWNMDITSLSHPQVQFIKVLSSSSSLSFFFHRYSAKTHDLAINFHSHHQPKQHSKTDNKMKFLAITLVALFTVTVSAKKCFKPPFICGMSSFSSLLPLFMI
jgi:hypothetical protein